MENFNVITKGINNVISISKIKKIIAIKKNCIEKGNRGDEDGSNPHSKGEFFSRSKIVFFDNSVANNITINEIKKKIKLIKRMTLIIYTKFY